MVYNEEARIFANLIKDKNKLKAQISKPTEVITYLKRDINFVRAVEHPTRIRTNNIGHAWVIGHPTNGKIGTGYNGIDGNQILIGSAARGVSTVIAVVNPENTFYEDFSFDLYVDTDNTDATVNTTTRVVSF